MTIKGDTLYSLYRDLDATTGYVVRGPSKRAGELGECPGTNYYKNVPECPYLGVKHGDELLVPPDVRDLYLLSKTYVDLLWFPGACLVRKEHVGAITAQKYSGIEFRSVNLYENSKCRDRIDDYVEMHVVGRVPLDMQRSGIKVLFECPICGAVKYSLWELRAGLHFLGDMSDWPDAFMMDPLLTLFLFVKPEFAQFLVDQNLRPLALTRLEDLAP